MRAESPAARQYSLVERVFTSTVIGGGSKTSRGMAERASLRFGDSATLSEPIVLAFLFRPLNARASQGKIRRFDWAGGRADSHAVEVRLHSSVEMELARELDPFSILSVQWLRQRIEGKEAHVLHFQRMSP